MRPSPPSSRQVKANFTDHAAERAALERAKLEGGIGGAWSALRLGVENGRRAMLRIGLRAALATRRDAFDASRYMQTLSDVYAHLTLVEGFFVSDPHPGNLMVVRLPTCL